MSSPYSMTETPSVSQLLRKEEVIAAVRSMLEDGLRPFGRVLLKRLRERAAIRVARERGLPEWEIDPETMPRLDPRRVRTVCGTCEELVVQPEGGREYSVFIRDEPTECLDVTSNEDPYPEAMWARLRAFVDGMDPEDSLPGGRYACARELLYRRRGTGVEGMSLAQVCHIVHLALSSRKVIGYKGSSLVSYSQSGDLFKVVCARESAPTGQETLPVATWDQAICGLRQLTRKPPRNEVQGVAISNVKRLFRSSFGLELCQTALGHVRLLDLLRDPRFSEVFNLQDQQGNQGVLLIPCEPPGIWETEHLPPTCSSLPIPSFAGPSTGNSEELHHQSKGKGKIYSNSGMDPAWSRSPFMEVPSLWENLSRPISGAGASSTETAASLAPTGLFLEAPQARGSHDGSMDLRDFRGYSMYTRGVEL